MTPFAAGRQLAEPSETPLTDRIVAGFAALPSADVDVDVDASPYWTTSLHRPTGFVPVDLSGPTPERVAHGLLLALAAVPVGVALAFTTGRAGSVTVLAAAAAAAAAALGVTLLYRLGARSIGRRGVGTVCSVVLLGALLEVVAIAASGQPPAPVTAPWAWAGSSPLSSVGSVTRLSPAGMSAPRRSCFSSGSRSLRRRWCGWARTGKPTGKTVGTVGKVRSPPQGRPEYPPIPLRTTRSRTTRFMTTPITTLMTTPLTRRQKPMPLTTDTTWRRCVCCGPQAESVETISGGSDEDAVRLAGDPGEHERALLLAAKTQLATHGVWFE